MLLGGLIISRYHAYTSVDDVMECLKQIAPEQWQDVPVLRQFVDDLPQNPYCTNTKGFTYIRNKTHAIRHRYIQPNHPAVRKWIALDIDDPEALFKCFDLGLPLPQILIKNPANGHAHLLFKIATPVGIGGRSSIKAMRYLASVERALALAFGADKGYSGNLIKNPCYVKANAPEVLPIWINEDEYEENGERDEHETYIVWGAPSSYTLAELADKIDLNLLKPEKYTAVNDAGFGRNCTLFDELRHRAYKLPDKSYRAVESHLKAIADDINNRFDVPLPYNEVKHIIKSIARYCERTNFDRWQDNLTASQRARALKRWGDNTDKREQAKRLKDEGLSCRKIAERLSVGKSTVSRWLK